MMTKLSTAFAAAQSSAWSAFPQRARPGGRHSTDHYLSENHRSDSDIVQWCNAYITSFPQMGAPNVRFRQACVALSGWQDGAHLRSASSEPEPSGMCHGDGDPRRRMRANGIIQDYSQCVLLLRSTRNSQNFAGPYIRPSRLKTFRYTIRDPKTISIKAKSHSASVRSFGSSIRN